METKEKKLARSKHFVAFVIDCIKNDKGAAAALRRADNSSTSYQSWEYLVRFTPDLSQLFPFGLISAALVKGKIRQNGHLGIGAAIANCYTDRNQDKQAKAKLRRLLACDTIDELCLILRPLLRLIEAKCVGTLDYARLLDDICYFELNTQRIKSTWAQNFYSPIVEEEGRL